MPPGKEVVVIEGGGVEATVKLRTFCAERELASVTCTVKLLVPVTVGVPEITPVAEASDKPVGKAPVTTDQV